MIKLKDSVNYEHLKKYGFEESPTRGTWYKEEKNDYISFGDGFNTGIIINPLIKDKKDREIVFYVNNDESVSLYTDDLNMTCSLDTLYDLIKDGLVEKV